MNADEPIEGVVTEIIATNITQQHEAAAMDIQVATAQALGRSIGKFQKDLEEWACHTQEIAEECTYILRKGTTTIIGPSIRFAELLQQAYRHIVCDTFIEEEKEKYVVVGAMARDLYRNTAIRARVRRNILDRNGRRYGPDMIQTTTQAAASLALRNAIIRLIPKALWQGIWLKSRDTAQGVDENGKRVIPFSESVNRAVKFLGTFEVSEQEILAHMGYESRADINQNDLTLLRNKARSIRAGEIDAHAAFPENSDDTTAVGGEAAANDVADRVRTAAAAAPKKKSAKKKAAAKPPKEERIEQTDEPAHAEVPMAEDDLDEVPSVEL